MFPRWRWLAVWIFTFLIWNSSEAAKPPLYNGVMICKSANDSKYSVYCNSNNMSACNCPPGYNSVHYVWYDYWFTSGKSIHRNHTTQLAREEGNAHSTRKSSPNATEEKTYEFTQSLPGEWEDVVGYVGFQYTDPSTKKDYIACLIGLYVEPIGNDAYKSEPWDKKIFWLDAGDGAPMHVCAIYAPNYVEDGVEYDNVYWSPNFLYLPPGVTDESQARFSELWMYLDEDDEVDEVWVDVYDENYELVESKKLGIGDQLKAFTPVIDTSEPESFLAITLEDRFQTVKKEPLFLYEHMTPNVDFVNEMSKGFDFDNADLLFILHATNYNEEEVCGFTYTKPKNVGIKWGDQPAKAENWFVHEVSSVINFFIPSR